MLAAIVFMLEYNVRAASVLGVVDAGGIGYDIKFYLDIRNFTAAFACLLLIFAVVVALDAVSARLRRRLVAE
jgi:phosphonate transport system permease protein